MNSEVYVLRILDSADRHWMSDLVLTRRILFHNCIFKEVKIFKILNKYLVSSENIIWKIKCFIKVNRFVRQNLWHRGVNKFSNKFSHRKSYTRVHVAGKILDSKIGGTSRVWNFMWKSPCHMRVPQEYIVCVMCQYENSYSSQYCTGYWDS